MRFAKSALALAGAAVLSGAPATAAVNIVVEGGGTPIVYEGDNGNRFAVLGIDARQQDANTIVDLPNFTVDEAFIRSLIVSGPASRLQNAFFCPDFAGGSGCAPLTSVSVPDEARLFNSLLLEFTGTGNIVLSRPSGGTTTLSLNVTRQGPPPLAAAVPEPSTWAMLLLGFFAIGAGLRRRAAQLRPALTA
ncbi:PEPxxWA-CTERM sorting domain-containing protein [Qipengyuania thermophila]|uniref:PEPxxWA-CTERM sorting domain-containing protein n=1 Tax=Qipengyuania thermophila TaxID=2509361 RepID=UPI001F1A5394|nr:PEPxxWA-CTERM sorting domain-containing protein [Qipengyuania thermophila]